METVLLEQEDLKTLVELYRSLDEYITFLEKSILELPAEGEEKDENI